MHSPVSFERAGGLGRGLVSLLNSLIILGIITTDTKEYNILYYIIPLVHSFSLRKQPKIYLSKGYIRFKNANVDKAVSI